MSLIADMIRPKRSGTYNPERWLIDWVNGGAPTSSGVNVNENTALKYTPFWACVRVISGTLASLPFIVYRRLQEGKERVNSHPVYRLLHDRPNEFMDTITFIETRQAHVLTYGNGYAEIQRDNGGRPIVLWPLLPDRTFRKISDGGIPYYEVHPSTGEVVHLPDHNVLHIKGLGFDGYTGYDVVSYHKEAIGYGIAVKEYGSRFFGSGASPGGVLEHPSTLSDAAAKRLSDSWDKGSSGLTHAHRTRILEEGMKWTPIGVEPEHAQALEVQKYTVDDCSRIFNIPPHKIGSLERATFCLPADVEVYTENGNKSIADVIAGENVWSLSNNDEWVLSPVLRSECTGVDDILHIRTSNRAIRANAKHKILVRRKYNRPKQGKGGRQWNEWVSEYVPAGDLKVGDVLVASDKLPNYGINKIGERELTSEFVEFCGLLLGDGNVNPGSISIARANNASYMDHYRKNIKKCFRAYDGGNGKNGNIGVATKPVILQEGDRQTRFSSVLASHELTFLGFTGNAHTKNIPSWVFKMSESLKLFFLRGFLDADGSVDKKGRISFSSCNEKLLSGIRHLCISCGVSVTNTRCQEGVSRLPNGSQSSFRHYYFTCSNPADNQRIGSNDPRYIERLKNGNPFNRKNRKYPWHGGRGFDVKGCSLSRITSITKEPPEKVYDLEVAGTHSFIANGVVVHNSNIEEQNLDFVTQTMLYWFRKWEQECNYKLFMPSETSRMFCEILADGLLRGNLKSRYEAYNIGRNGGWLSADDIREKENMNPLPDGKGKIYLEPLNMKEAGTEPEPTDDDVRQAHYDLIRSQVDRVLTKQKNTGNPDYEWAEKILNGPVTAWASLSGVSGLVASRLLSFVLQKELSTDDADTITDLIMKKIQGVNYVN